MRIALHTLGMLALGAVCLLAMGIGFDMRVMSRVPVSSSPLPVGTFGGSRSTRVERVRTLNATLRGFSQTATAAADSLRFGDSDAAALLDAAWHVADVIAYAGARPDHGQMRTAIESARRSLQNGDRAGAAELVRKAARIADTVAPTITVVVPGTDATYRGATVLDSTGNRLGTIDSLDDSRVVLESPGLRNLLGFLTIRHGVLEPVPRSAVLLGEPRRVGETLAVVVVPPGDEFNTNRN